MALAALATKTKNTLNKNLDVSISVFCVPRDDFDLL